MNTRALLLATVVSIAPAVALAASPFDGTWKTDPSRTIHSTKPITYRLAGGVFECSCVPPIRIAADGAQHPVAGNPYIDTASITIVDDHTVREDGYKGNHEAGVVTFSVAPDGKTLTSNFSHSTDGGAPVTMTQTYTRLSPAPAGAHALTGSWHRSLTVSVSDNARLQTFAVDGETLHWSTPTGPSYTAKLDGTDAPYTGDPGVTTVSVRRVSDRELVETDKRDGKPTDIYTMTVSPNGDMLKVVDDDQIEHERSTIFADKQP